jgi:hypothetical protein
MLLDQVLQPGKHIHATASPSTRFCSLRSTVSGSR